MTLRQTVLAVGVAVAAALSLAGCGASPGGTIAIQRGQLPPGQVVRQFSMDAAAAGYDIDDDGLFRVLLGFPLPGSTSGRPVYYLYLRMPGGDGPHAISLAGPGTALLLQSSKAAGQPHEVALAVGETVTRRTGRGFRLAGRFDLIAADESRWQGKFVALPDPRGVAEFERSYLHAGESSPATSPD